MKPIVYAKRLLKLANILEALPREKFNYGVWGSAQVEEGERPPSCGTTACALGWAVSHPDFKACARRDGHTVGLVAGSNVNGRVDYFITVDGQQVLPGAERWAERAASELLFGLNVAEHEDLFLPRHYEHKATPKYVAAKIRKFVETKYGKGSAEWLM